MSKLIHSLLASGVLAIASAVAHGDNDAATQKPKAAERSGAHKSKYDDGNEHPVSRHWMAPKKASARRNPIGANVDSEQRGQSLFQENCASCHGTTGRGDGPVGKALTPPPADLAVMAPQHSDGDFAWKISEGRGVMPAWKGILSEAQIWDLVNFIKGVLNEETETALQQRSEAHEQKAAGGLGDGAEAALQQRSEAHEQKAGGVDHH